ncbi:DUF805 domain-containing protein [Thiocystis violacea]|uniref:DUF805 domain-containing protein n=1 Tax=Thiocystis violacea TaxID=13725 RepID=UPI001907C53D|nr:DUF805 domain-containing protein [Thiocystis violacea]MBK1722630.1 hypothetical protein [Thiocystis violacea]
MLKPLYGELTTGRLKRLPYLGYYILVSALILLVGFGIGASVGLAERMQGGEVADAQALLQDKLGLAGLLLIAVVFGVLFFAHLNLAAKRIRDIGLPGWWILLSIAALGVFASIVGGSQLASGINLLILFSVFMLPSDAFGKVPGPKAGG